MVNQVADWATRGSKLDCISEWLNVDEENVYRKALTKVISEDRKEYAKIYFDIYESSRLYH